MKKIFDTNKSITKYYLDIDRALKNNNYIKFKGHRYSFFKTIETDGEITILYKAKTEWLSLLNKGYIEFLYIKNSQEDVKLRYIITGEFDEKYNTCNDGDSEIIAWECSDSTYLITN